MSVELPVSFVHYKWWYFTINSGQSDDLPGFERFAVQISASAQSPKMRKVLFANNGICFVIGLVKASPGRPIPIGCYKAEFITPSL